MKEILVPIDFTEITQTALDYAVNLAVKVGNCNICLLHVVGEGFKQYQLTLTQMVNIAYKAKGQSQVRIQALIREGSIFTDINDVAEEKEVGLIVMGTHGTMGLRNLFGERAKKVITTGHIPFIVVEQKHAKTIADEEVYRNILCPINLTMKSKEYIEGVLPIIKQFNSIIHLVTYKEQDSYLAKKLDVEIENVKEVLRQNDVLYMVKMTDTDFDTFIEKAA